jgi:hypothetical protein
VENHFVESVFATLRETYLLTQRPVALEDEVLGDERPDRGGLGSVRG